MAPTEQLPDAAPFPVFFLPNFVGIFLALLLERIGLEDLLARLLLGSDAHRYSLVGIGVFALANANSYLGGSVVLARIKYNVKLPNLYANRDDDDDDDNKDAITFNTIQRGHQTYPQIVQSLGFTAVCANRPCTAGFLAVVIAAARIAYARGYASANVGQRMPGQMVSIFATSVGIGYAALMGLTAVGIQFM